MRVLDEPATLPAAVFPISGTLLDLTLKEMAANWEWHAQYDDAYLGIIPTRFRELLLSYIATYHDETRTSPLQVLFLSVDSTEHDCREVKRLDLSHGLGMWTQLKALEKDMMQSHPSTQAETSAPSGVPDSWDEAPPSILTPSMRRSLEPSPTFPNLAHLSLALSQQSSTPPPSWKALIRLAEHLPTLQSLSLANWPMPTYTPVAASTRVTVSTGNTGSSPRVVYGGTNMYSALDSDWREAAGILRSLSRKLPALTWLDVSGCGSWWDALMWHQLGGALPSAADSVQPGDDYEEDQAEAVAGARPDWNGAWRGVKTLVLKIGWSPVKPEAVEDEHLAGDADMLDSNSEGHRRKTAYARESRLHGELKQRQRNIMVGLRAVRREGNGAWMHFVV